MATVTSFTAERMKAVEDRVGIADVTGSRPTEDLLPGFQHFDTTLGIPIWYDGTNWVDATGATV